MHRDRDPADPGPTPGEQSEPGPPLVARHCAILAGGAGSRLGGGKASVEIGGVTMVERVRAAAVAAGLETTVIAKPDTDLGGIEGTVLHEPEAPRHPLLGIAFALEHLREPLVVCPCDLPLVPPPLLAALAARPEPLVVLGPAAGVEPLVGRYPPAVAADLRTAAREGRPAGETVLALGPALMDDRDLEAFGDPERFLLNVNTPAALETAEALVSSRER